MSQISLKDLEQRHPELQSALSWIGKWFEDHPVVQSVQVGTLARDLKAVPTEQLARAQNVLVKEGFLSRTYKVLAPSGALAEGEFANPAGIPPRLPDRFENYFDTSEADVIPVFKRVA